MSRRVAVILGVGPGTGASIARRFSKTHSVFLLSRSLPGSIGKLNLNIPEDKVFSASSDGSNDSLKAAFEQLKSKWPEAVVDVGVYNTNFHFTPGKFLERSEDQLRENLEAGVVSGFNFAQHIIRLFLKNEPNAETKAKGTLIFTGATMAMRGGAPFSTMAPAMFARRALTQSLAREFGPQGIHVAHVIVDGMIEPPTGPREGQTGQMIQSDDIAHIYADLVDQRSSAWTQELDLRPSEETF